MVRKSPQEKKRLSYEKDRRNCYGEHDKGSRTSIRRNKRAVNAENRRLVSASLDSVRGVPDEVVADHAEERFATKRLKFWRKWRDEPLGDVVQFLLARRDGDSATRVKRIRQRMRQSG